MRSSVVLLAGWAEALDGGHCRKQAAPVDGWLAESGNG
jgi:hypothetical protein